MRAADEAAAALSEAGGQQQSSRLRERGEALKHKCRELRLESREQLQRFLHLTDIFKELRRKEAELLCLRKQHEVDAALEQEKLKQRELGLARREAVIQQQKQAIEQERARADSRVKLNVGGQVFETSTHTLTRCEDSMLAAMFSGRHELAKDEQGNTLLDRDPHLFGFVLNYLRNNLYIRHWQLPRDREVLEGLKMEADYFLLAGLARQCQLALERLARRHCAPGKWRVR